MTQRIISRKEFRRLTSLSRTTEWRMLQNGLLPKTIVVGKRILGYLESDYQDWLKKNTSKDNLL